MHFHRREIRREEHCLNLADARGSCLAGHIEVYVRSECILIALYLLQLLYVVKQLDVFVSLNRHHE